MKFRSYILVLFSLSLGILSCKEKTDIAFSQSEIFELASPKLTIDSVLFKNSARLTADFMVEGAKIYYTSDGSHVDETSLVYENSISITKSGAYKFKTYHPDYKPSQQIGVTVIKTNYTAGALRAQVSPPPHKNYPGKGSVSLIDFKKGTHQFRNGNEWLGFQSPSITIDLNFNKEQEISKIILSTLKDHNAWIFKPESITASSSLKKIGEISLKAPIEAEQTQLAFIEIPVKKGSYSNLEIQINQLEEIPSWHQGKGTAPFFFIDEILVE
jgi:hypothetical protein